MAFQIRATVLRSFARNRVFNKTLNGLGYVARAFHGNYSIGRSRSLAEILPHLAQPGTLEIRADGIFLNHTKKLSTNTFLIESFLKHAITQIETKGNITYKELSQISRGKIAAGESFEIVESNESTKPVLSAVENQNNKKVMRLNALAALYGGIGYAAYKIYCLAASTGNMDAVDVVCASVLTFCSVLYASINGLKQKFVADSVKYVEPTITEQEKVDIKGQHGPKVSVLVPAYNEPVDVLRKTLSAASQLDYTNYEVVLLLDSKPDSQNYRDVMSLYKAEFKANGRIKVFARKKYADVPNQKLNKADNINAFLNSAHGRTIAEGTSFLGSDFILVTDADYRLKPEFLVETVPLIAKDKNTAYVMTPQNFALGQGNAVEQGNAALMSSSWQQINKGVAHSARVLFGGCNSILRLSP